MADCVPPEAAPRRRMPSWLAAPLFVFGVFLVSYVSLGMPLPPAIRLLLAVPAIGLTAISWRSLKAPLPTALFWGGAFWAYAMRILPAAMIAGIVVSAVGGIAYLVRTRRPGK